jgi:hypothetical protein
METLINHYATKYQSSPDLTRIATELGTPGWFDSSGKLVWNPDSQHGIWFGVAVEGRQYRVVSGDGWLR